MKLPQCKDFHLAYPNPCQLGRSLVVYAYKGIIQFPPVAQVQIVSPYGNAHRDIGEKGC
jgi:hypothetical protein